MRNGHSRVEKVRHRASGLLCGREVDDNQYITLSNVVVGWAQAGQVTQLDIMIYVSCLCEGVILKLNR
jgi:hypothetical protein